jgi:hypothetical protein
MQEIPPQKTNKASIIRHIIYVVLPLIVAGVVFAYDIWSLHHLASLLTLATFILLPFATEAFIKDWSIGRILSACLTCYGGALIAYLIVGPNLPLDTDTVAYLIPANKPTPKGPCEAMKEKQPEGSVALFAGGNEFWSNLEGGLFKIITLDDKPVVTMKKTQSGLLFSIDLFGQDGKIATKIRDNKAILISKNFGYPTRSNDRSALSLYDDYDEEILYVEYLNNNAVLIRGVFNGPKGADIAITDNEIIQRNYGNRMSRTCALDSDGISFSMD